MKKEEGIPCGACMATLPAPEDGDWTTCPACGRGWELNSEHTGIKSVTLDVQSVSIDANSLFFRGVKNHG